MKNGHAIRFGIFAGIGTILILFLFYWIEKQLMLSAGIIWSTFLLYILGMYMAPNEERKENEGFIEFRPALKSAFIVYMIANGIYHLYTYLLYNFIDKDMLGIQQEYMRKESEKLGDILGDANMETFISSIDSLNYNFGTVLMAYITSLIWGFLWAAIIAGMVKRRPLLPDA